MEVFTLITFLYPRTVLEQWSQ